MRNALQSKQTSVASSASSVLALASSVNRRGAVFTNDDGNQARLLLSTGTASATNYSILIPANGGTFTLEAGDYAGECNVIWDAAGSGGLRVTEFL